MSKTKNIILTIVFVVLILCTVIVSYAAYSSSEQYGGSVKAKSFNTSNTVKQDIPVDIWLGETKYYYFEVENCDDKGKVSAVDIVVSIAVKLRAFEDKPYRGLTLTIEEYMGEPNSDYDANMWQSVTGGVIIVTEGILEGASATIFPANQLVKRQFRIKYVLPDTIDNATANGFYVAGDTSLLNVKSAVDIQLKINQNING